MKKLGFLGAVVAAAMSMTTNVMAAQQASVVFGANEEIRYEGAATKSEIGWELGEIFKGIAPGETRTEVIELKNENENEISFYMTQDTIQALEETNQAAGGAYHVQVLVGENEQDAVSLLNAIAGGYKGNEASAKGLSEVDGLEDYTFLTTLEQDGHTNLYLTIALDGEGMDSNSYADYTASTAGIEMNFEVAYGADTKEPHVIHKTRTEVENVVTPLASSVKTGDETQFALYIGIFVLGIAIVVVSIGKKRGAKRS